MTTRYVKTKIFKRTIGKACIIHGCSTSAKVTTVNKSNGHLEVALCLEHAEQRGLVNGS